MKADRVLELQLSLSVESIYGCDKEPINSQTPHPPVKRK
jgi:hypothetical protein